MEQQQEFVALGHAGSDAYIGLETFPNPGVELVEMVSDELTGLCPITNQPDCYTCSIEYHPQGFFEKTARALIESGVRRLVVAGGETSGAAVSGLALDAVTIGPEIDPGVPALRTLGHDKVALALKSGNFGSEDFFAKALDRLEAGA